MGELFFPALYVGISVAALAAATYTDLRARIVPNKLVYSIVGIGIALKAAESFLSNSPQPLFLALQGMAIAFGAGYVLYRLGVWAGGDVKLVAAIALLNPINYALAAKILSPENPLFGAIGIPIFGISLIIYSTLAILPTGFFMGISAVLSHRQILEKVGKTLSGQSVRIVGAAMLYIGLTLALKKIAESGFAPWLEGAAMQAITIALIFGAAFLPPLARKIAVGAAGAIGLVLLQLEFIIMSIGIALPLLLGFGLWRLYIESREHAFRETVKSAELQEGMVPDVCIVQMGAEIEMRSPASLKSVINQLRGNKIGFAQSGAAKPDGKVLFSPEQAGGLTEEEAQKLRALAKKGKIPGELRVRKTMAFVPAVLFGYIALQFSGDLIWKILL